MAFEICQFRYSNINAVAREYEGFSLDVLKKMNESVQGTLSSLSRDMEKGSFFDDHFDLMEMCMDLNYKSQAIKKMIKIKGRRLNLQNKIHDTVRKLAQIRERGWYTGDTIYQGLSEYEEAEEVCETSYEVCFGYCLEDNNNPDCDCFSNEGEIKNKVIKLRPLVTSHECSAQCAKKHLKTSLQIVRDQLLLLRIKAIIQLSKMARSQDDVWLAETRAFARYHQVKTILSDLPKKLTNYQIHLILDEIEFLQKEVKHELFTEIPSFNEDNYLDLITHKDENNLLVYDKDAILMTRIVRSVKAQMEEPHGECQDLNIEQKENVILTSHAEESKAQPITVDKGIWEKLCSPQDIREYTQLMARWQRYKVVKWSRDLDNGASLFTSTLPQEFIDTMKNSPNVLMFKQYAYFRSDMEIKIVINSNKFHAGSLQASFYYGASLDARYNDRNNIFSASQMTHCILDAASATDGVLTIPFRHYKPLLATTPRADDNVILDLGLFRLFVLNKLKTPVDDNNEIDVTIFFRFINPSFHGMQPRDLVSAKSEMMGISQIIKDTTNLVNQVFPDAQRDNPSNVIPAKPMIPWSSNSWCLGDKTSEPTNPLRLQAVGNTPHPPGTIPDQPEMQIDYITSIFGMISQVKWNTSQKPGSLLLAIPFSPVLDKYPQVKISNPTTYTCDIMPPVSVLSNLFGYWRGSLEYKLDFIATQFHTGRLIIAYLPRIIPKEVTLEQLTYCDHIVVDLRDERQVLYTNSFLSDKPWWPRRKYNNHTTEIYPPGYIYIMVMNTLTATSTVTNEIDINIYLRAGSDFELHVPVNPDIGLSFNTDVTVPKNAGISYLMNYGPPYTSIYTGQWHSVSNRVVLRYGPVTDHITQFDLALTRNKTVYVQDKDQPKIMILNLQDRQYVPAPYLVLFNDGNYGYGAPFLSYANAKAFLELLKDGQNNEEAQAKMEVGGDTYYFDQSVTYRWYPTVKEEEEFEVIKSASSQMDDERKRVCGDRVEVQKKVNSTWNGLLTFGEQISSIKPLIRRYAPYMVWIWDTKAQSNPSLADLAIPIVPQGLDLNLRLSDNSEDIYGNRIRDGPISILASGYRFYRGDMRLRLIVSGQSEGGVWIQHRPEYNLRSLRPYVPDAKFAEAYFQPGYASYIQMTDLNNVLEFEIPFYLPGQFGLLQRPDLSKTEDAVHFSLGTLFFGFDTMKGIPKNVPTYLSAFYSMGDNMSFSVFQGFPPMIDLSKFSKPITEANAQGLSDMLTNFGSNILNKTIDKQKEDITRKTLDDLANNALDPKQDEAMSQGIIDILSQYFPDLNKDKKALIVSVFLHLVHSIINPSFSTIAWTFVSILVTLGILAVSFIERMVNSFKRIIEICFNSVTGRNKKTEPPTTTKLIELDNSTTESNSVPSASAQADFLTENETCEAAFVSTAVAGMLAVMGAKDKPLPKTLPNFASYLYNGSHKFTLTANGLFNFLRNNLKMFKKMWYWIVGWFNKDYIFYAELSSAPLEICSYIKQIQFCLDAENSKKLRTNPKFTSQVYELANIAQSFLAKRAISSIQKDMPMFVTYCKKIIDLRNELAREFLCPPIRFEPYVIGFNGAANVGKSHLAQHIGMEILESIDYKSYEEITYVRTPGVQYWNGLQNQPIVLFDDFLNIEHSDFALQQIGELFCLKSKAVFNPPMAAIEEKKLRYNPLMVLLCSNKCFQKIDGIADETAWKRRRDTLIEVRKRKEYRDKNPRDLSKTESETYAHLEFYIYPDPVGADPQSTIAKGPFISYQELLPILMNRFRNFYDQECEQYHALIAKVRRFLPEDDESTEDYCKRVEAKVKELNDYRLPGNELDRIMEFLTKIRTMEFRDDMSKILTKRIISENIKKVDKEIDKKSEEAKRKVEEATRITTQALVHKEANAQGDEDEIHEDKGFAAACKIENESLLADMKKLAQMEGDEALARKLNEDQYKPSHPLDLKVPHLGKIEPEPRFKFFETFVKKLPLTISNNRKYCTCVSEHDILGCISVSDKVLYCTNERTKSGIFSRDQLVLNGCENSQCCLRDEDIVEFIISEVTQLKKVADHMLPEFMVKVRNNMKKKNSKALSVTNLDDYIKEINDTTWYERLWSKIPSFGTVFVILVKALAIFGTLALLVQSVCSLLTFGKEKENHDIYLETEKIVLMNDLEFTKATSDNDPVNRPTYLLGVLSDQRTISQSGTTYSAGVVGAKVQPVIQTKEAKAQSSTIDDVVTNLICKNTFFLNFNFLKDGKPLGRRARCLGLCKKYFLMLDHYDYFLNKYGDQSEFSITYQQHNILKPIPKRVFASENTKGMVNSAFVIRQMPIEHPDFKNIIKFFMRQDVTGNVSPKATLHTLDIVDNSYVMQQTMFDNVKLTKSLKVNNENGSTTIVNWLWSYPKSKSGLCGSILVSDSNLNAPIMGMHIAGDDSVGYSESIIFEDFSSLLNDNKMPIAYEQGLKNVDMNGSPKLLLKGNVNILGTIPVTQSQHPATKSRLVNTICAGKITPITMEKPVLSSKDPRFEERGIESFSPLLEGVKHHANPCLAFPIEFLNPAVEAINDKIFAQVRPRRVQIGLLSYKEAISGLKGNPLYEGIPMDTSEGFPWSLMRPKGCKDKSWMFKRELKDGYWEVLEINSKLEQALIEREELRRNNIYYPTIFVDTLKDAKLPSEKVMTPGKTRIFSTCPIDYTIIARRYTMDFVAAYIDSRIYTDHAIGIDIEGSECDRLVNYMLEYGDNQVCGDYSKFGDQLYGPIVFAFFMMISQWYEKNGYKDSAFINVMKCLAIETCNATHLILDLLYQSFGGIPSGNPLTTIINSYVNTVYIRMCWLQIMYFKALTMYSMRAFEENVRIVTFGDDLWLSVKDAVKDLFNAETIAEVLAMYNIKFTNATKGSTIVPYLSINHPETTFLKRTFHRHEHRNLWVSRLEERVVLEICNWTWSTQRDIDRASIEACVEMCKSAYGHGREYHDALRRKVIDWWQPKGINVSIPTWEQLDHNFFDSLNR